MSDSNDTIRLDKWLWQARFCRTRSIAADLIAAGGVRIDGRPGAKPASSVRPGQVLTFALGRHVRVIRVRALGVRRGPAVEARTLYDDLSPPTPDTALPA
jgi:ribosome-associated heat shock protein Hsp15